ncbi:MAG: DUF1318 domain-containing protein [Acidobacteriota bacterium]
MNPRPRLSRPLSSTRAPLGRRPLGCGSLGHGSLGRALLGLAGLAALTAVACVTINVYFPEAAVKDLSERIEDAVAREAAAQDDTSQPSDPSTEPDAGTSAPGDPEAGESDGGDEVGARLARLGQVAVATLLRLTAPTVQADTVAAPEVTNPAIRRIIDSRAGRLPEIQRYKQQGVLGENNRALLEIRDLGALALQERAAVQRLVKAENQDRERMFREIAAATQADLSQLPQIQQTYAETLRQKAARGEWIQMPDGTWRQK